MKASIRGLGFVRVSRPIFAAAGMIALRRRRTDFAVGRARAGAVGGNNAEHQHNWHNGLPKTGHIWQDASPAGFRGQKQGWRS
jgi:hypothetical protein